MAIRHMWRVANGLDNADLDNLKDLYRSAWFNTGVSNSNSLEGHFYKKKMFHGPKIEKKWLGGPQLLSKTAKISCFAVKF
jgi:hypothetical protein